jgi:hypothetical protein
MHVFFISVSFDSFFMWTGSDWLLLLLNVVHSSACLLLLINPNGASVLRFFPKR